MGTMKVLVTGPLKGSATRGKGLIEVSKPELVFVVGPLGVEKPLNLDTSWFFVRGPGDNLKVLSRSGGVELFSRVFRFKNTLYFSGISGVFHPSTFRFTRREWIKARRKIDKKSVNYIFKEDIDELLVAFKNSGLKRLDILLLADSPFKAVFKEVVSHFLKEAQDLVIPEAKVSFFIPGENCKSFLKLWNVSFLICFLFQSLKPYF